MHLFVVPKILRMNEKWDTSLYKCENYSVSHQTYVCYVENYFTHTEICLLQMFGKINFNSTLRHPNVHVPVAMHIWHNQWSLGQIIPKTWPTFFESCLKLIYFNWMFIEKNVFTIGLWSQNLKIYKHHKEYIFSRKNSYE